MRVKNIYHFALALLGGIICRSPSREIFVAGVTGTKGKSTTIEIAAAIMERAGCKTAVLSTIRRRVGSSDALNDGNTMPGRFALQKFLREAVRAGAEYAFIEVTSQGVVQHRHKFIDWDAAFFTNLAPEHIEAHGGFEKYKQAKLNFFRYLARSEKKKRYFFVLESRIKNQELRELPEVARAVPGAVVKVVDEGEVPAEFIKDNPFFAPEFNRENAALAIAFARSRGVSDEVIAGALRDFPGVPGRLEFVQKEPFAVVVDYAHTPDSLKKLLNFLRENQESRIKNQGSAKLVCVFGSMGGSRDKWKRPEMGRIAAEFCDEVILTNEDPCDDEPEKIINEIEAGVVEMQKLKIKDQNENLKVKRYWKIVDRQEAIQKAISLASSGDVVAVTGKGSQQSITIKGGRKIPWSDKEAVIKALKK